MVGCSKGDGTYCCQRLQGLMGEKLITGLFRTVLKAVRLTIKVSLCAGGRRRYGLRGCGMTQMLYCAVRIIN